MENAKKYSLGLALSGGGARGFAHAGALRAIEEGRLKPDIIAGVSAGAVAAVLYAAGVEPQRIPELFSKMGLTTFTEFGFGGGGLFRIDKFKRHLMQWVAPYKNLEDLPIPLRIVATDLELGESVVFDHGHIGDCVIASCSIPIVFKPAKIDGHLYVDGGVLQNLPSRVLRDDCHKLIGINVSPEPKFKGPMSMVDVAMRSYYLLARATQRHDKELCDLLVETREISTYRVFNLKEIEKVYKSGYVNTRKALREAGWWQVQS